MITINNYKVWDTKEEFEEGTFTETRIEGSGVTAKVSLEIEGNKEYTFETIADFLFSNTEIEFVSGKARPKRLNPEIVFYANYTTNIFATYSEGVITAVSFGGAVVSAGKLDISTNNVSYVVYQAVASIALGGAGTFRFKYTRKYVGSPAKDITIGQLKSSTGNPIIRLYHSKTDLHLYMEIYNDTLVLDKTIDFGIFPVTIDVEHDVEIGIDLITGVYQAFVDGIEMPSSGSGIVTTESVDSALIIGADGLYDDRSNFIIDDVVLYNVVQHTANFTPPAIEQTKYYNDVSLYSIRPFIFDAALVEVIAIEVKPTTTEIKYIVSSDSGVTWKYYNTINTAWEEITAAQTTEFYIDNESNDITELNTNIATLASSGSLVIRVMFRSGSNERAEIDNFLTYSINKYELSGEYQSEVVNDTLKLLKNVEINTTTPSGTTISLFVRDEEEGIWNSMINGQILDLFTTFFSWKAEVTGSTETPLIDKISFAFIDVYCIYDGWTIDRRIVSYYLYGNRTEIDNISDQVCIDAVSMLKLELNGIKTGLYDIVSKTDEELVRALHYFAACIMIKNGLASPAKSGPVTSESLEGMSISYANAQANQITTPLPKDWCNLALDTIQRWARTQKLLSTNMTLKRVGYRDKLFQGTYNKYTKSRDWES